MSLIQEVELSLGVLHVSRMSLEDRLAVVPPSLSISTAQPLAAVDFPRLLAQTVVVGLIALFRAHVVLRHLQVRTARTHR